VDAVASQEMGSPTSGCGRACGRSTITRRVTRNVSQMCRFFEISRTQFYKWLAGIGRAGSRG
jgi:hypothetical protein